MTEQRFDTLSFFKKRRVARDVRLMAAHGQSDVAAVEQLAILVLLLEDEDAEIRRAAAESLRRVPDATVESLRSMPGVPAEILGYRIAPVGAVGADPEPRSQPASAQPQTTAEPETLEEAGADRDSASWIDDDLVLQSDDAGNREGVVQKLARMNFSDRIKAAMKGSREVRAILIRDPSKLIASAVLKSPKLTEPEVEGFARLGNVAEDVLRAIGNNRAWMKNYGIVLALTKNAKTPLALSLNLLNRLNDRDVTNLSSDRNVPEPLRVAARRRVVSAVTRR